MELRSDLREQESAVMALRDDQAMNSNLNSIRNGNGDWRSKDGDFDFHGIEFASLQARETRVLQCRSRSNNRDRCCQGILDANASNATAQAAMDVQSDKGSRARKLSDAVRNFCGSGDSLHGMGDALPGDSQERLFFLLSQRRHRAASWRDAPEGRAGPGGAALRGRPPCSRTS